MIAPTNEREYEPCFQLASAHPDTILFADKGFWGAKFKRTLEMFLNTITGRPPRALAAYDGR